MSAEQRGLLSSKAVDGTTEEEKKQTRRNNAKNSIQNHNSVRGVIFPPHRGGGNPHRHDWINLYAPTPLHHPTMKFIFIVVGGGWVNC